MNFFNVSLLSAESTRRLPELELRSVETQQSTLIYSNPIRYQIKHKNQLDLNFSLNFSHQGLCDINEIVNGVCSCPRLIRHNYFKFVYSANPGLYFEEVQTIGTICPESFALYLSHVLRCRRRLCSSEGTFIWAKHRGHPTCCSSSR